MKHRSLMVQFHVFIRITLIIHFALCDYSFSFIPYNHSQNELCSLCTHVILPSKKGMLRLGYLHLIKAYIYMCVGG